MGDNMEQKRIEYLDFARGFAILFMILQHAMIVFDSNQGEGGLLGIVVVLLGTAPAAPVFMFIMGIFFARKKATLFHSDFLAGIKLVFLGYLLNLLRFVIPNLLTFVDSQDNSILADQSSLDLFLSVDILQMAGFSWIIMAILKKIKHSSKFLPVLIIGIAILSPFLWNHFSASTLLGIFGGTGANVYFPIFPWIIYPLLGVLLSNFFTNRDKYDQNLNRAALIGTALIVEGSIFLLLFSEFQIFTAGDYHRSGISIHLIMIGFMLIWFWICNKLVKFKSLNPLKNIFRHWSLNVTKVYFIQWILIGWSIVFLGENRYSELSAFLFGIVATIITHQVLNILLKKGGNSSK